MEYGGVPNEVIDKFCLWRRVFFTSWHPGKIPGHEGLFWVDQIKLFPPTFHSGNSGMARAQLHGIRWKWKGLQRKGSDTEGVR